MSDRRDLQHPPEKQRLKNVTRDLVKAVGGLEAADDYCRPGKTQLAAYYHLRMAEFMPADVIADLEAVTHGQAGHPHVTRYLARAAGYELVRLPKAVECADWHQAIGALSKEVGEVVQSICQSLGDPETPGVVTAGDIKRFKVIDEIDEAIGKLVAMRALAKCAEEGM